MPLLIDHVLGTPRPSPQERWRLRKGDRAIVIDEVHDRYVCAHDEKTGRRTTLLTETLVSRYVRPDP